MTMKLKNNSMNLSSIVVINIRDSFQNLHSKCIKIISLFLTTNLATLNLNLTSLIHIVMIINLITNRDNIHLVIKAIISINKDNFLLVFKEIITNQISSKDNFLLDINNKITISLNSIKYLLLLQQLI